MMVVYHMFFDLNFFGYYTIRVYSGGWMVFARVTAILFISLAGVGTAIGCARLRQRMEGHALFKQFLVRGLKLVGWGMVISLVLWGFTGRWVVFFGVLHLIGVATILAYPFLGLGWLNLPLAAIFIVLGFWVKTLPVSHPWFMWLGLKPATLYQLDHFPLLPWFGVTLLGVFVGQALYLTGERRVTLPNLGERLGLRQLAWLGRHSLAIYLLHQPLIFAILNLITMFGLNVGKVMQV
jgi:uncharacterized membrane protein